MANELTFDPDASGLGQKLECLADYFECVAWLGSRSVSAADVADYVNDRDLVTEFANGRYDEQGLEVGLSDDSQDDALLLGETVREIFDARSLTLGDHYPFQINAGVLSVRPCESIGYLSMLAIVADQHFGGASTSQNERAGLFEELVAGVLVARCGLAARFGANRREFPEALRELATALQLDHVADDPEVPTPTHANDDGLDAAAHVSWGDQRPGKWVLVGQATVGEEGSWERKMAEVRREHWRRRLVTDILPWRFLAIPHHASDVVLKRVVTGEGDMVLDRLRLAPFVADQADLRRFTDSFAANVSVSL